ncbi:MAG: hypothetical protein JJU11_18740 [Candidatus Sumerlaeia bacterium]|nr:hypothetical protein [Candidatus Sumerlaeia bacterium]
MPSEKSTDLTKAQFRGLEEFVESHKNSGLARLALTVLEARMSERQTDDWNDDLNLESALWDIQKRPLNWARKQRLLAQWDKDPPKTVGQIERFFEEFERTSRKFNRKEAVMRRLDALLRWRKGYPIYEVPFAFLSVRNIAEKLSPEILQEEASWLKEKGKARAVDGAGELSRQIVASCLKSITVVRQIDGVETSMKLQHGNSDRTQEDRASIKKLRGKPGAEESWWNSHRKSVKRYPRWKLVPFDHADESSQTPDEDEDSPESPDPRRQ